MEKVDTAVVDIKHSYILLNLFDCLQCSIFSRIRKSKTNVKGQSSFLIINFFNFLKRKLQILQAGVRNRMAISLCQEKNDCKARKWIANRDIPEDDYAPLLVAPQ